MLHVFVSRKSSHMQKRPSPAQESENREQRGARHNGDGIVNELNRRDIMTSRGGGGKHHLYRESLGD